MKIIIILLATVLISSCGFFDKDIIANQKETIRLQEETITSLNRTIKIKDETIIGLCDNFDIILTTLPYSQKVKNVSVTIDKIRKISQGNLGITSTQLRHVSECSENEKGE